MSKNSLKLNGSYYLTTPISTNMPNQTIEFYVKILDISINNAIIGKGLTSSDSNDELCIAITGGLLYIDTSGSSTAQCIQIPNAIVANEWYHIAVTKANDLNLNVYINGVLKASANINTITNSLPIIIGRINRMTTCNCLIDEIRLWNITRTQSDIQSSMNTGLRGNETGLVFYYKFNDDINGTTTVLDSSRNTNDSISTSGIILSNDIPNSLVDTEIKYLIKDKNNTIYTYNGTNIVQSPLQVLNSTNFKENGFDDPLIISEEIWDNTFPNKTGLQLLKWTDDASITESTVTCNVEPYSYKPIDQFGENKILGASFSTTDNKTFTVDPLTNVPFKQNSVICYKDGIEAIPDEINYDEGIVVFNTEQIGIMTFDYTYIVPFDILLYKPNN